MTANDILNVRKCIQAYSGFVATILWGCNSFAKINNNIVSCRCVLNGVYAISTIIVVITGAVTTNNKIITVTCFYLVISRACVNSVVTVTGHNGVMAISTGYVVISWVP